MASDTQPSPPQALLAEIDVHRERFVRRYGEGDGIRTFFSPGRINLMGAHLDYNGGPVMPMAIDRGTFIALRPRSDSKLRLASTFQQEVLETSLASLFAATSSGAWFDYPLGVARFLLDRHGGPRQGADVLFGGNLPIGAGLSSSASICVGTAVAFQSLWEAGGGLQASIQAALWAEREFVGVHCGIMDPFAVALTRPGHLLWLDCKDESIDHLPLDTDAVSIAVIDTGVRRGLAQGSFNERVRECARAFEILAPHVPDATCLRDIPRRCVEDFAGELEPLLLRRARHVTSEVERTFAAREALARGDLKSFGSAVAEAHGSLRDLFEVSIPELDLLIEASLGVKGVLGGRLTGAGFGGCVVVVLENAARQELGPAVEGAFEERFGRLPAIEFFRGSAGPREVEG